MEKNNYPEGKLEKRGTAEVKDIKDLTVKLDKKKKERILKKEQKD